MTTHLATSHTRFHRFCAMVGLVLYVVSHLGCPVGSLGAAAGCQCDLGLQKSNQCCCSRAAMRSSTETQKTSVSASASSCCQTKELSQPSCCQTVKKQQTCCLSTSCEEQSAHPSLESCGCGDSSDSGVLLNNEPQCVGLYVSHSESGAVQRVYLAIRLAEPQCVLCPDTPPPQVNSI